MQSIGAMMNAAPKHSSRPVPGLAHRLTLARFDLFTLTVAGFPEPSTYAASLGGLDPVGVAPRRRHLRGTA